MGSHNEVGIMAVQARLKLMESTIIPSVLYNIEAYPTINAKEMTELEKLQHQILIQLLNVPKGTPYVGLLMELGMWQMKARVHYRKHVIIITLFFNYMGKRLVIIFYFRIL